MKDCMYFDHHASTPLDEKVFEKMKTFFLYSFGNPASVHHKYGWQALEAVNQARLEVAQAINAHPTEIIFTSGATESTNLALKGLLKAEDEIISSSIEHSATLASIKALIGHKISAKILKPESDGRIDPEKVRQAMTKKTAMVSLYLVNNEIGSINDVEAIGHVAKDAGVLFHCDAAQALGRVAIDCRAMNIDLMSLSGHKAYGPKGVGVLYVRRALMSRICPLIDGGGQEWAKRSGTLNVPGIVGMGEAARLAVLNLDKEVHKISLLRDRLWARLQLIPGISLNGGINNRVAGNLNISFYGIDGEELVLAISNHIALSTSSACASAAGHGSRVLEEIGVPAELRQSALRIGLGRSNTADEIERAANLISDAVSKLRLPSKKLVSLG